MKKVFCPKCAQPLSFDESKYPEGKVLAFLCPRCGARFKVKLGRKEAKPAEEEEREAIEPEIPCGSIGVIENAFAYKQELPLRLGDNVIGRKNKDTDGVDVPIVTSDPSMGRKHCVINVRQDAGGRFIYTLRDFPSLTGTFIRNTLVGKKERVRIDGGEIVTIGATTFILRSANPDEMEDS